MQKKSSFLTVLTLGAIVKEYTTGLGVVGIGAVHANLYKMVLNEEGGFQKACRHGKGVRHA